MKHYSLFAAAACILISLTSCEKKDYSSYPPTWKGFQFTCNGQKVDPKTGIFAGDEITVTALQDKKGQLINATTYNWTIIIPVEYEEGQTKNDTIVAEPPIHTNYDGTDNGDPSFTFTVPSKAIPSVQSHITFSASYSYSGYGIQVEDGRDYSSSGSISGSIYSTSGSMYGKANGSVRFYVNAK